MAGAAAGALPEVIGEADFLFDPKSAAELSALIGRVLTDDAFARRMVANGRRQVGQFTWERSARTAIEAMRDLVVDRSRRKYCEGGICCSQAVPCGTGRD